MGIQTVSSNLLNTYNPGANNIVSKVGAGQMAIQQQDAESNTRIFADFNPYHSWGIYHNNPNNAIEFTKEAAGTTPVLRYFTEPGPGNSVANTAVMSYVQLDTGVYNSVGGSNEPYAQIEDTDGQTFASNAWTTINYASGVVRGRHITVSGTGNPNINFTRKGVYFVGFGMRIGAGSDVWTGFRVLKNSSTELGLSYGTGQVGTNDPGPLFWNCIISVDDVTVPYQTQVYRSSSTLVTGTPAAGPAYALTIWRISSLGDY